VSISAAGGPKLTQMRPKSGRLRRTNAPLSSRFSALRLSSEPMSSMNRSWKTAFRSLYYRDAPAPEDPRLESGKLALLVIDVQNVYLKRADPATLDGGGRATYDAWTPFHERMHATVVPAIQRLLARFRADKHEVLFARIACQTSNGRDRSLSQKLPGWNNLLLPKDEWESQIVPEIAPRSDEIVLTKTTDSAVTGTNLRLLLTNLGISQVICCGIFTDQCVSSTVRSLADESFSVIVVEDACAAASDELHRHELEIINMIYCHVMSSEDLLGYLPGLAGV
jgi:biuret amidohydrolase